jgi:hypothetical protein
MVICPSEGRTGLQRFLLLRQCSHPFPLSFASLPSLGLFLQVQWGAWKDSELSMKPFEKRRPLCLLWRHHWNRAKPQQGSDLAPAQVRT